MAKTKMASFHLQPSHSKKLHHRIFHRNAVGSLQMGCCLPKTSAIIMSVITLFIKDVPMLVISTLMLETYFKMESWDVVKPFHNLSAIAGCVLFMEGLMLLCSIVLLMVGITWDQISMIIPFIITQVVIMISTLLFIMLVSMYETAPIPPDVIVLLCFIAVFDVWTLMVCAFCIADMRNRHKKAILGLLEFSSASMQPLYVGRFVVTPNQKSARSRSISTQPQTRQVTIKLTRGKHTAVDSGHTLSGRFAKSTAIRPYIRRDQLVKEFNVNKGGQGTGQASRLTSVSSSPNVFIQTENEPFVFL